MKNFLTLFVLTVIAAHFYGAAAQDTDPVINKLPVVAISGPSNGTTFTAPASFSLNANASDPDGMVVKVEFYNGTSLLGTAFKAPYSFNWSNVPLGVYSVTVKATDDLGGTSTSSAAILIVTASILVNQPPSIVLTAPLNNTTANAPGNITINADAADADGWVYKVEFYNGSLLLGTDYTAPYSYVWMNVNSGGYTITAKAIDNQGASKISTTSSVTLLAVVTDVCTGLVSYIENGGYVAGSKVKNNNGRYECKPWPYSGWCNGSEWAYAPGAGAYWTDAWNYTGACGSTRSSDEVKDTSSSLKVMTNPVFSSATISLVVKVAGFVSVTLQDKNGEYIRTISEAYFEQGTFYFSLNLDGYPGGFYLVKSVTSAESKVVRVQKVD